MININMGIIILFLILITLWCYDRDENFINYGQNDIPPMPLGEIIVNPKLDKMSQDYNYEDNYSGTIYESSNIPLPMNLMARVPGHPRIPLPINHKNYF